MKGNEMPQDTEPSTLLKLCEVAQMTPTQCNAVIEEKLTHLVPVLESTLVSCKRVSDLLANGGFNWRKVFKKAKARHLQARH